MGAEAIVAGVAAIVGAVGGAYSEDKSADRANKIERKQESVRKAEQSIQNAQAARQRRASVRKAQVARAQIENVAGATGQGGSSAPIVSAGGVSAQAGGTVSAINTNVMQQNRLTSAQTGLNKAMQAGPSAGEKYLSQFSSSIFNQAVGAVGEKTGTAIGSALDG